MQNDTLISVLNNLIETCKDGEIGFRTAADGLTNPTLKTRFQEHSRERGDFARALQAEVRSLGGEPEKDGSTSASLHRGWMDIKSAITGTCRSCDERHTARYLAAYEWRFNRRFDMPANLARLARTAITTKPQPYRTLAAVRPKPAETQG